MKAINLASFAEQLFDLNEAWVLIRGWTPYLSVSDSHFHSPLYSFIDHLDVMFVVLQVRSFWHKNDCFPTFSWVPLYVFMELCSKRTFTKINVFQVYMPPSLIFHLQLGGTHAVHPVNSPTLGLPFMRIGLNVVVNLTDMRSLLSIYIRLYLPKHGRQLNTKLGNWY